MPKMPKPPHPVDKCTSTELRKYIADLNVYLDSDISEENDQLARVSLGSAYSAYNVLVGTGAAPAIPEITHSSNPQVIP